MQVTTSAAIHPQIQRPQIASEHGPKAKPTSSSPPIPQLQPSGPNEPISDGPARIIVSHLPLVQTEGPQTPDKPDNPVDALLAQWGASDSPFDLDGDGTVGTGDLMLLLGRIANGGNDGGEPTPQADDPAPGHRQLVGHIADTVLTNQDQDGDGLLTVADLGNRPGLFERLDSDGDGVVSQTDLTNMISEHLQQALQRNPDLSPREYAQRMIDFFDREREPALPVSFAGPTPTIIADNNGDVLAETPVVTGPPQVSNIPGAGLTTSADPIVAATPTLTSGAAPAADSSATAASFAERIQEMFAEVFGNRSSTLRQYADMSFDPVARALAHRAESVGPEAIRNFVDHADLSPSQKDTLLSRVSTYLQGFNVVG